ncbi:MAG: DegT/DnrJ/EryC1/StrS family aminotransferase [Candidatus Hydrogenedentota bacterium]
MANLACLGGKPVRTGGKLATWPVSDAKDAQLVAAIAKSNRWSFDGPYEWEFAEKFTAYQGAKYGMCCINGTVGIQLALEALDIGAYDEVIVPGMTWQATASGCLDVNAVPILTDVDPETWCLDLDAVEANITERTKAVIVVHLYGSTCNLDQLVRLCKKHNLALIEDCAHQHGTFWKGKGVGSFGDVSSWSFQESKTLTGGEGGFNMCKTKKLFERLYALRNCGRHYEADPPVFGMNTPADPAKAPHGGNYRIGEFQAAMLLGGLRRLDKQVKLRDKNAIYLNSLLEQIPGIRVMKRHKQITQQNYFNFAFRIDPEELGVENRVFCHALNVELGFEEGFEPPYDPLNNCGLYKPHTKPRYNISKAYWKAIDPARFKLPVCEEANYKTGVVVHQVMLMNKKADMEMVAGAVKKLVEHKDELKKVKLPQQKKYKALGAT